MRPQASTDRGDSTRRPETFTSSSSGRGTGSVPFGPFGGESRPFCAPRLICFSRARLFIIIGRLATTPPLILDGKIAPSSFVMVLAQISRKGMIFLPLGATSKIVRNSVRAIAMTVTRHLSYLAGPPVAAAGCITGGFGSGPPLLMGPSKPAQLCGI